MTEQSFTDFIVSIFRFSWFVYVFIKRQCLYIVEFYMNEITVECIASLMVLDLCMFSIHQ